MPKISKRTVVKVAIFSAIIGLIPITYGILISIYRLQTGLTPDILYVIGLVIALFPTGIVHLLNIMWKRGIDRNIPKLLRQIAEAGRIGVSIPEALEIATRYELGPLTPEIKKAVAKLSWGYPLEKVINDLIEELDTPTATRALNLILEASKSGGDIEEMFMMLQRHISGLQLTLMERRTLMRPYISYGYIAFFIFLAIEVILLNNFFLPILEVQNKASEISTMFQVSISIEDIKRYFYHISLIEAVVSGLISGKMGEGTMFAGLKHVAILLLATLLTFYLFIF